MSANEKRHEKVAPGRASGGDRDGVPDADEMRFVERWADVIDDYARGRLDAPQRRALEREADADARLREALDDALVTRRVLAGADALRAPESLDDRILAAVDRESAAAEALSRSKPRRTPAPRPSLSTVSRWGALAAVAAAVVLLLTQTGDPWRSPQDSATGPVVFVAEDGTSFSEAEVRAAAEQMELAMSLFGRTVDRTAQIVRRDVSAEIHDHVTQPLEAGLSRSVDSIPYLRRTPQNDEHSGTPVPPASERPLRSRALESAYHGERT